MKKKIMVGLIIFSLMLFTGCVDQNEPEVNSIILKSKEAGSSLNTYTYDANILMVMEINGTSLLAAASEDGDQEITMDMSGAADLPNKKMYTEMSISLMDVNFNMEQYYIGNTQYMKIPFLGWVKNETEGNVWEAQTMFENMNDISYLHAERLADETVGGSECYVIRSDLDIQEFSKLLGDSVSESVGSAATFSPENLDSFQKLEMTQWISKDTYLTKKVTAMVDFEMEGSNVQMDMSMEFDNFDEPLDITLPDAAENAVDISDGSLFGLAGDL